MTSELPDAPRQAGSVPETRRSVVLAILGAILAAAAVARFAGLEFGLPLVLARPDEQAVASVAVGFWETGDLNPHFFDYPTLHLYVIGALYGLYGLWGLAVGRFDSAAAFAASWPTDWVPFFMIPRVISATAGTATVLVVYLLARRMFGRASALVAALFMALAFLHVRDSHYGTTDATMTLLLVSALALLVRAHQTGVTRHFVAAGVVAGLAMATKYNAFLLVVPATLSAAILAFDAPGPTWDAVRRTRLFHVLVPFGATFALTTPYVLLDFGKFRADMAALAALHTAGMTPPDLLGIGWVYHLTFSLRYGLGLPLLVAGLAGAVWLTVRRLRVALILLSFPIAYYIVAGSGYTVYVRYMLPVVPFLCVTAGFAVVELSRPVARALRAPLAVIVAVVAVAVIWPSARSAASFDRLMRQRDSRLVAGDWVRANVPAGATIFQAGNLYGHLQLEDRKPFRYRHWTWDRLQQTFLDDRRAVPGDWPEWIVVQESALPYSYVPDRVVRELRSSYRLAYVERAVDANEPRNVYDVQDAFYAPYGGFVRVRRPGPNVFVYQRMTLEAAGG